MRRGESLPTPPPPNPSPHPSALFSLFSLNPYSLRASFPFGGYREKYTREWHARGNTRAGGGGEEASRGFVVRSRVSHSRGSLRSPKWRACSQTITSKEALIFKLKTKLICSPTSPPPPLRPVPPASDTSTVQLALIYLRLSISIGADHDINQHWLLDFLCLLKGKC